MTEEKLLELKNEVMSKLTDSNICKIMDNDNEMFLLLVAYTQAFREVEKVFKKYGI